VIVSKRIQRAVLIAAALAALALGGSQLADARSSHHPAKAHTHTVKSHKAEPTKGETETPERQGEQGSEVPNNDGPGGHTDEPGNPNANHEFQGVD
jgi:hypothetical protein